MVCRFAYPFLLSSLGKGQLRRRIGDSSAPRIVEMHEWEGREMTAHWTNLGKRVPLQPRKVYGWLRRQTISPVVWHDKEFIRNYTQLRETETWPLERLEALQLEKLTGLLAHAYSSVPYYRRCFDDRHITPDEIRTIDDLHKLPVLTKQDVRNNVDSLVATNISKDRIKAVTTSGSTGQPLLVYHDSITAVPREDAFRYRQWAWAGYRFGDPVLTLRGGIPTDGGLRDEPPWWGYNSIENELVLASTLLDEAHVDRYVTQVRQFRPRFIHAFPSSIELFARLLSRARLKITPVKALFCESEMMFPEQRRFVEALFNAPVFLGYGNTERSVDAVECECHSGYHVSMEYGIVELLGPDDRTISTPDTVGRVISTGFDTYCMPFIRYDTGDLATFSAQPCPCGRQLTLLREVKGRTKDFLVSRTGTLVSLTAAYSTLHAAFMASINEIQFAQAVKGDVIVRIVLVPGVSHEDVQRAFLDGLRERLTPQDFDITIEFVDRLPHSGRGKLVLLDQKLPIELDHYKSVMG